MHQMRCKTSSPNQGKTRRKEATQIYPNPIKSTWASWVVRLAPRHDCGRGEDWWRPQIGCHSHPSHSTPPPKGLPFLAYSTITMNKEISRVDNAAHRQDCNCIIRGKRSHPINSLAAKKGLDRTKGQRIRHICFDKPVLGRRKTSSGARFTNL